MEDAGGVLGEGLCCAVYSPCRAQFMLITAELQRGNSIGGTIPFLTPSTPPPPLLADRAPMPLLPAAPFTLPRPHFAVSIVGLQQYNEKYVVVFLCILLIHYLWGILGILYRSLYCREIYNRTFYTNRQTNKKKLYICLNK